MKKRIFRVTTILIIAGIAIKVAADNGLDIRKLLDFNKSPTAYAVGDLTVDWGVGVGDVGPIFNVPNMAPGQMEPRDVDVSNGAGTARPVGVRGIETSEIGSLSAVLDIEIKEGATTLYGPKTLDEFFTESAGPDGIPLSTVGPGGATTYTFKVTFKEEAGNEFQNTNVVFDLKIGIAIAVPVACEGIDFDLSDGLPIFGTDGNDTIQGTPGNDLIFGLEGNDKISGHGGNDCLVGNEGNDKLRGGNGNDLLVGGEDDDKLEGGNGSDLLFGNEGNDNLSGGNESDEIFGGGGNDQINGGNDSDVIDGEEGNDNINGGNDSDTISGGDDDDTMNGGNDGDNIDGNSGTDSANGGNGNDACDAETETTCEI